ncbi:MAG: S41 family peptidase [Saprospiraceae bacterium]
MEKQQQEKYNIIQPLLLAACVSVGMMIGFKMNDKPQTNLLSTDEYPLDSMRMTGSIEELLRFIEHKYVDTIQREELIDEALEAIFSKLDPHSVYLSPSDVGEANDHMNGFYSGIGIENFLIDDTVNISGILDNSPAKAAGLKVFDKIISIDGRQIAGKSLAYDVIRTLLRKSEGSEVLLEIWRDNKIFTTKIKVSEITVRSVTAHYLNDINTGLIKIDRFGNHTYKEFMEEVEKIFGSDKARHLILDLRDNPGGYLPEATNILCQLFEEKDKLLLYTQGRNSKRNEYKSTGKRFFDIDQVVVLVDENSASASEIVAGAIQDWDRGVIVGRRTYGKGLVQEQYALNNGGAIRLTTAKYFTPSGRSIQRNYKDRSKYDDDFTERYEHGDLFYQDSTLVKNGGKYFTKVYQREISGSGGISPDIFIPLDTIYKDERTFEIKALLPEFAYKYASANRNNIPTDQKQFAQWRLPDDIWEKLETYLKSQSEFLSDVSASTLEGFDSDLKSKIRKYIIGNAGGADYDIDQDMFVQKAKLLIRENKQLSALKIE